MARAAAAGVEILSVTDHDTVAGCAEAATEARTRGVQLVTGIEITAVLDATDVHVLGYFFDSQCPALDEFLATQRRWRLDRVRQIVARLAGLGVHLDADAVLAPGVVDATKAAGRPWIARALLAAGHVESVTEAFDLWLGRGRPAFVPRVGVPPAEVFDRIHHAGGLASLAHPGLTRCDESIPGFVDAGLDAIEVYHSKHDPEATERYEALASRLGLAMTGGSDDHGDPSHSAAAVGTVSLPRLAFERLVAHVPRRPDGRRATTRATASGSSHSS